MYPSQTFSIQPEYMPTSFQSVNFVMRVFVLGEIHLQFSFKTSLVVLQLKDIPNLYPTYGRLMLAHDPLSLHTLYWLTFDIYA